MNTEPEMPAMETTMVPPAETPSADFIHAISAFLDTDPDDLLVELGYYTREADDTISDRAMVPSPD